MTVPITMVVARAVMKRSQGMFIDQWRRTGRLNAHIEETFSGHALVKVFGRQEEVEATFAEENEKLYEASFGAQFVSGLIMPTMMFIGNLNYVVIAVLGGLKVANGSISLGDVQAFIQYSRQFTQPLTQVASMANLLQSGRAPAPSGSSSCSTPRSRTPTPRARRLPTVERHGEVRFEHVSFSYDPERPLIEDLSLVAAAGPDGGDRRPDRRRQDHPGQPGDALLRRRPADGSPSTASTSPRCRAPTLRDQIGMVLQDTWLFEGTIRDNIAYGRPGATEDEILEAARATYVDRFVHSLPDGYDTHIDEEGSNLSAGERQLVTIARAFLSDPELLILDEATSSVDTRTELLLQHAMAALRTDRTSFVIAHRLSTIRDADLILVMEDGAIVEQGTHDSLLLGRRCVRAALQRAVRGPRGVGGRLSAPWGRDLSVTPPPSGARPSRGRPPRPAWFPRAAPTQRRARTPRPRCASPPPASPGCGTRGHSRSSAR